jgi:hypothetical protein
MAAQIFLKNPWSEQGLCDHPKFAATQFQDKKRLVGRLCSQNHGHSEMVIVLCNLQWIEPDRQC